MSTRKIKVEIIASPIACEEGIRDDWRDLSKWLSSKLDVIYGNLVTVQYFDIFDSNCPPLPPQAQLPIIKVGEQVLSMGEKLSMPRIREQIDSFLSHQ